MATRWWKTGWSVPVLAIALLMGAIPASGGDIAQYDSGAGSLAALNALDGSFLTLPAGQSVIVKFTVPVGPTGDYWTLRIHMDGTTTGVTGTQILLSADGATWRGYLGDDYADQISEYIAGPDVSDGLTNDWFQFSVYRYGWDEYGNNVDRFPFSTFQYVKIQAPAGASISIDAVEAYPFTTLASAELEPTALDLLDILVDDVIAINNASGIPNTLGNSLEAKLEVALGALEDANTNNDAAAVNKLQAFINEVEAQAGKQIISPADAVLLIAQTNAVIAQLTE